ncbi:hypothetical protein [Flavobacterium sp.]|uniref:hypothetical protein n=1 Tax=Flavobacterium sp. TaxID=239 RepID=UPI00261F111F|nr:hypothetical protein [Flavobacterium sp.]
MPSEASLIDIKFMKILDLNLDHYSEFELLYELGFRFYTNDKNVKFYLNIDKTENGKTIIETFQGEREIYFFSLWKGYYSSISNEFINNYDYNSLPQFIKNYNEGKGWDDDDDFDLITNDEIDWLISKLNILKLKNENIADNLLDGDIDCISDLINFLMYVKVNDMELRISQY